MYINKVQIAGDYVLVSNYTWRLFGAPHRRRNPKSKETPKAMSDYNRKKRAEKLWLLMILNFDKGYHVTLDYPKGKKPATYEEAEKNLKKFLYAMSRKLKPERAFKYIAITERGKKRAALHHHLIMEGDPFLLKEVTELWGRHMKISPMYEEGAYEDLAEYLCKIETKEEQTKGLSKYHRSRNLKKPIERTRIVALKLKDDPVVPKGYDLMEDTVRIGFNEHVGIRYQKYMIKKKPEKTKKPVFGFKQSKSEQKGRSKFQVMEDVKKFLKGAISDYRDLHPRKNKKPSKAKTGLGEILHRWCPK